MFPEGDSDWWRSPTHPPPHIQTPETNAAMLHRSPSTPASSAVSTSVPLRSAVWLGKHVSKSTTGVCAASQTGQVVHTPSMAHGSPAATRTLLQHPPPGVHGSCQEANANTRSVCRHREPGSVSSFPLGRARSCNGSCLLRELSNGNCLLRGTRAMTEQLSLPLITPSQGYASRCSAESQFGRAFLGGAMEQHWPWRGSPRALLSASNRSTHQHCRSHDAEKHQ